MYDSDIATPRKLLQAVEDVVNGQRDAKAVLDELYKAYEDGNISSSSYDHLVAQVEDYVV